MIYLAIGIALSAFIAAQALELAVKGKARIIVGSIAALFCLFCFWLCIIAIAVILGVAA